MAALIALIPIFFVFVKCPPTVSNFTDWIIHAVVITSALSVWVLIVNLFFDYNNMLNIYKRLKDIVLNRLK